ncbi:MAG: hypothetical protein ACXW28_12365, partial [Thermoanaerobaculia bacterium]
MALNKFVSMLAALTLVAAVGCGGGKEVPDYGDDEDEVIEQPAAGDTAAAGAPAAAPAAVANAATVTGLVKFEGAPVQMGNVQMGADPFCASTHQQVVKDEEVVLGPGGELANVLVYVKNAPAAPANTTPAMLDQKGCQYFPHVSAVQVGQPLNIKNSDSTLHNVHAMPETNRQFNEG